MLFRSVQGNSAWEDFYNKFEEYRVHAEMDKEPALYYLMKATSKPLFDALMMSENPPSDYDEWNRDARKRTMQARVVANFQKQNVFSTSFTKPRSSSQYHPRTSTDVDMDISAFTHKRKDKGKGKKKEKKDKQ